MTNYIDFLNGFATCSVFVTLIMFIDILFDYKKLKKKSKEDKESKDEK